MGEYYVDDKNKLYTPSKFKCGYRSGSREFGYKKVVLKLVQSGEEIEFDPEAPDQNIPHKFYHVECYRVTVGYECPECDYKAKSWDELQEHRTGRKCRHRKSS